MQFFIIILFKNENVTDFTKHLKTINMVDKNV